MLCPIDSCDQESYGNCMLEQTFGLFCRELSHVKVYLKHFFCCNFNNKEKICLKKYRKSA